MNLDKMSAEELRKELKKELFLCTKDCTKLGGSDEKLDTQKLIHFKEGEWYKIYSDENFIVVFSDEGYLCDFSNDKNVFSYFEIK